MQARIYQPARNAMQSGQGKSKTWVLEYVPEAAKQIDPLMGWQGSGDMNRQVKLTFESESAAKSYCEHHGIAYQVMQPKARRHIKRKFGYGDNFSYDRRAAWTH